MRFRPFRLAGALAVVLVALGGPIAVATAVLPTPSPGVALALDCDQLAGADAAQALALLPAPRIVNLHGSVAFVTMEPFATFLIGMGYPEQALRDPQDGSLSQSSFGSSEELAGALAWHYERDGLRPMLVGHSQGGMLVVRTLHELAGEFNDSVPVYDPVARTAQTRTTIRDPYTHAERPVVGVEVAFAAAIATGTLPRLLLGQWSMIPKLRRIPDTTLEFTGFTIPWDPIAGNLGTGDPYVATGTAAVRNVLLPSTYSHIGAPITEHLSAQAATRAWIDAWRPDAPPEPLPVDADADVRNIVHAADLWYSIRRHWCLEGQRRVRALGAS
jgi:hypothetical protein